MRKLFSWFGRRWPLTWLRRKAYEWAVPELALAVRELSEQNAALLVGGMQIQAEWGNALIAKARLEQNSDVALKSLVLVAGGTVELSPEILEAAKDPLLTLQSVKTDDTIVCTLTQIPEPKEDAEKGGSSE
jgi:hypothetical protein